MERLSSCYFCGDAVDAALEEYPLVDPDRHADIETDQRIVLCPTCRRKLTAVVEQVLEAALNGESADVDASEVDTLGDEAELIDLDESLDQSDNGEEMTATSVERVDDESERTYTSSTAAKDLSSNDDGASESGAGEDSVGDDAAGPDSGHEDESATTEADDEPDQTGVQDGEQTPHEQEQTTREQGYTRAEHNKVVKLLQNREFPVEIEEITVVARSAYGIDRDTTHSILEALIDRGVVEDRGDRLVRA